MPSRVPFILLIAVCLCAITGCGSRGDKPPLGYVSGSVMLDGHALPDATVFFSPESGGRTSVGHTDELGNYQLSYIDADSGAKVGPHVIRITTSKEIEDPQTGRTLHSPEKVPDRYNVHSELKRDVEPGENEIDLELHSK